MFVVADEFLRASRPNSNRAGTSRRSIMFSAQMAFYSNSKLREMPSSALSPISPSSYPSVFSCRIQLCFTRAIRSRKERAEKELHTGREKIEGPPSIFLSLSLFFSISLNLSLSLSLCTYNDCRVLGQTTWF
jgi:hypothetical protein